MKFTFLNSLLVVLKSPTLVLSAGLFSWFSIEYFPSQMLLFWLLLAMLGDFISGLLKSWKKGIATSSEGGRKSVTKVLSYSSAILVIFILVNVVGLVDNGNKYDLAIIINGLMGFIIFIELYSICENVLEAYPDTPLSNYFILPLMKFLRGKFASNQILQDDKNIDSNKPKEPFDPFPID